MNVIKFLVALLSVPALTEAISQITLIHCSLKSSHMSTNNYTINVFASKGGVEFSGISSTSPPGATKSYTLVLAKAYISNPPHTWHSHTYRSRQFDLA